MKGIQYFMSKIKQLSALKGIEKDNKQSKEDMTYKRDIEKFIKERWPTKDGETLDIRWMDNWEDHYRLRFMKTSDDTCFINSVYESRSILVQIEKTPDGWVDKEYKK